MSTSNNSELLDPGAAADLLTISRNTLACWRCTKRAPLPFLRFGRVIRYRKSDVLAFIEQHMEPR